jgi:hypothetical protein
MSYLGKSPSIGSFQKLDTIQGLQNGITTTFQLLVSTVPFTPENVAQLIVVKNGITLEPGVAYSVNGTNISFGVAPLVTDTIFIMAYGTALYSGVPSTGSVSNDKIADGAIGYAKLSGDTVSTILGVAITFGL